MESNDTVATLLPGGGAVDRQLATEPSVIELQARGMELTMEGMSVLRGDTYLWMNHAHADMYGWEPAPLIGRTWHELYTPETQAWIQQSVFPVLMRDGRWHGEVIGKKQDGSAVDIELSLTMAHDTLVCCCRDISVRKANARKLEESMRALDEANVGLRKAGRLKDEFLACMSHELRTPLHSMLGIAELLSEDLAGPTTERQRQFLEQLLLSGRHLQALINDLLEVSKIESGQLTLVREPVSLQYVIDVSVEMVQKLADEGGIELVRPSTPATVMLAIDERRMVQVLVNLLTNAVKFTPRGGRVTLGIDETALGVAIKVRDTGIGIAPADQTHLFEAFRQVDSSLTRHKGGTGLGLYLVKRLTDLHAGTVQVDSELGRGSVFTVTLPRATATPTPGDPQKVTS